MRQNNLMLVRNDGKLKEEILEQLRPLGSERGILFGSYAYGNPTEESNIDLHAVTKDDFVPAS